MNLRIISGFVFALGIGLAQADTPPPTDPAVLNNARAKGIAWLVSQQRGDGSWVDAGDLQTHATASALEALADAGMKNSYPADAAVSWLVNNVGISTDSLARTVRALHAVGADATTSLLALQSLRQGKFGQAFGSYRGYSSSMPDTALGIDALLMGNQISFDYSVFFDTAYDSESLLSQFQNAANGGWSYSQTSGSSSEQGIAMSRRSAIIPTANAMIAYTHYVFAFHNAGGGDWYTTDAIPRLQSGIDWLKSVQKTSGGFADDGDINGNSNFAAPSQVYESALVRQALETVKGLTLDSAHAVSVQTMINQIDAFLLSTQAANGSWGNDPLATAMALSSFPSTTLVDSDGDGLPDLVEQSLPAPGSTTTNPTFYNPNVADSRTLPKGNGNAPSAIGAAPKNFQITAQQGTAFSYQMILSGSTPPYNFQLLSALPKGVTLNYANGLLSGTPSALGDYFIQIALRDSTGLLTAYAGWLHVVTSTKDSDGDGMPDVWEAQWGLNPYDASDAGQDPDHDGLTNLQEYQHGTNPFNADTDGDGMNDGDEVTVGRNPLFDERNLPVILMIIQTLVNDN